MCGWLRLRLKVHRWLTSTTPVSGLVVQACWDAHLSNFGIFGSAERLLVFDVRSALEATATLVFAQALPGRVEPGPDESRSYAEWLGHRFRADGDVGA